MVVKEYLVGMKSTIFTSEFLLNLLGLFLLPFPQPSPRNFSCISPVLQQYHQVDARTGVNRDISGNNANYIGDFICESN